MKGLLIVNSFLNLNKFTDLYDFFKNASIKYQVELLIKTTDEFSFSLDNKLNEYKDIDFILFWDKDIYLAQRLESQGFRVFNSAKSIELCDNKALTTLELNKANIKIPKTIIAPKTFEGVLYNNFKFLENAEKELRYPMIIKEVYGSFGKQVYLAKNKEEAIKIINNLGYKDFIMQEFITESCGKDVRINVIGDKVISAMGRVNNNDYRSNITNGGIITKVNISAKQAEIAIKAVKALGLDFAGVDVLYGENDEPIICEVNSNPHFKSSLECTGIDLSEEIIKYIVEVLK